MLRKMFQNKLKEKEARVSLCLLCLANTMHFLRADFFFFIYTLKNIKIFEI